MVRDGNLALRLKVEVVYRACEVSRGFQFSFDERLIDDHFRGDIREFAPLPGLYPFSHWLEVPLHSVHTDRNAINEREGFRVFGKHRRAHA